MKKGSIFTISTILLNSSLTIMVGSVIAPALPEIVKNLKFDFAPGLLVTLPSLGVVFFSLIAGRLINKIGPFKLLSLGLIPYGILGFIGLFLTNNYLLILDRLLLGAACVAIQISVTTFIAQLYEGKERLKIIAWQGMAIELGGVIFLSLGGFLGEQSWQYPFYIYLIAILFFFLSWKSLPKTTSTTTTENQNSTKTIKKNRTIYPILIGSFFSMAIFFVCYVNLPHYLPEKFNFSESYTGYFMSSISLIAVLVASQLPKIIEKVGSNNTVSLGFFFFSIGYFVFGLASASWLMGLGVIATGIGFGFTVPLLNHMIVDNSNSQNRGKNLGLYSMMVFSGQFCATFTEFLPTSMNISFLYVGFIGIAVSILLIILFKKFK
ncbi:MFS transporter [Zunongwangia endophytica]|uniref:MFS transporter n=1 Tax=Zunongwangia endophytica TaxID=1808945 RepID=A0ABV8HE00_9FLAO|nr:MFS transporter [Zunongwangia endophytica]MDN3596228.1 MFS transporter [Zunongwangia endophytica]